MNKIFSMSSSDETSKDQQLCESGLFQQIFYDAAARTQMQIIDKNAGQLAELANNLAVCLEFDDNPAGHIERINRYLDKKIIDAGYRGSLLVKLLYSCKHFVHANLSEYFDSNDENDSFEHSQRTNLTEIFPKIAPQLTIRHHDIGELGTFEILINNQCEAFFKAGVHRQRCDTFLHHFYLKLKEMMNFQYDADGIFPQTTAFQIALYDVVNKELPPKHTQYFLSHLEREEGYYQHHNIDMRPERQEPHSVIIGGIQNAIIPEWEPGPQENLQILLLMSLVLMLGGRDVTQGAVRGRGCIIDFEEFLEQKPDYPDIHLPFVDDIIKTQFSSQDWQLLNHYLQKINRCDLKKFLAEYRIDTNSPLPAYWPICEFSAKPYHRQEFTVQTPEFHDDALLYPEQVDLCLENLRKLQTLTLELQEQTNTSLLDMLCQFCPKWKQQCMDILGFQISLQNSTHDQYFDRETIDKFSKLRSSPIKMAGILCRSPSPINNHEQLLEEILGSDRLLFTPATTPVFGRTPERCIDEDTQPKQVAVKK